VKDRKKKPLKKAFYVQKGKREREKDLSRINGM
jgi:hypothetical protein